MELRLIPIDPTESSVRIPYRATAPFDRGDFHGYPERKGWSREELFKIESRTHEPGDRGTKEVLKTPQDLESFLQTWLYFGTLISVFAIGGVQVEESDFVVTSPDGNEALVTTAGLPHSIDKWKALWEGKDERELGDECQAWVATKEILDEVIKCVNALTKIQDQGDCKAILTERNSVGVGDGTPDLAFEKMAAGIITLYYALTSAACDVYRTSYKGYADLTSRQLKERLMRMGWCKWDIQRLSSELGVNGLYYLALQECPQTGRLHTKCDNACCRAANIDEASYVTKHVDGCEGGDEMSAESVARIAQRVVEAIDEDEIPVISLRGSNRDGGIEVIVQEAGIDDIDYVAISHVWSDGLGNPRMNSLPQCQLSRIHELVNRLHGRDADQPVSFWIDTLCVPVAKEHKKYRQKSIAQMCQIYESAISVLVLDSGLQKISISSRASQKIMGIYLSSWVHRLWTFQESLMNDELYIQFADGAQSPYSIKIDCWKLKDGTQAAAPRIPFPGMAYEYIFGYLPIRSVVSASHPEQSLIFVHVSRNLAHRATSKRTDEAICAATIMRLPTDSLLSISGDDEEDVADRRMEKFLKLVKRFPAGIIFHHQPRLQRRGFRWAPRTIMGAGPNEFSLDMEKQVAKFRGYGLPVQYPGIIIDQLRPQINAEGKIFVLVHLKRASFYHVELFLNPGEESLEWYGNSTYALVMLRPVSEGSPGTDAILCVVETPRSAQKKKSDLRILARYECRAHVESLDESVISNSNDAEFSRMKNKNKNWLIL